MKLVKFLVLAACISTHVAAFDFYRDDFEDLIADAEEAGGGPVELELPAGVNPVLVVESMQNFKAIEMAELGTYQQTAIASKRDVLDLPALYRTTPLSSVINLNIFLNSVAKLVYGEHGTSIDDLTTLADINSVLGGLDKTWITIKNSGLTAPDMIDLLRDAYAQEWRVGGLLDLFKRLENDVIIGLRLPIYYLLRHWNMPLSNRRRLMQIGASLTSNTAAPSKDTDYFPYVINDAIGLGDARLTAAWVLPDSCDRVTTVFGGDVTLPSSWAVKRGVLGNDMAAATEVQIIDLGQLYEALFVSQPVNEAYIVSVFNDFGPNAVYQMGAVGLGTYLGMEKQAELGIFIDRHFEERRGFRMFLRGRAAVLLPRTRSWYFNLKKNPADFNPDDYQTTEDPEDPVVQAEFQEKLEFLEVMISRGVFPIKAQAHFDARAMVHAMLGANFDISNNWEFFFGYDFWCLQGDQISKITLGEPVNHKLDIAQALRPTAIQNKMFGGITYTSYRESCDVEASLVVDQTFSSKAIGEDFTVNFMISWVF